MDIQDQQFPKEFGPYEILHRLGAGGMGSVFKALDKSFDRFVALKITDQSTQADDETILRFEAEALAMKRLEHHNIVPVYNYGLIDDHQYIAMKYIDGRTLGQMIDAGKLPFSNIVDISKQICRGLRYAHKNGIVHRDVKPTNIILSEEGRVYLMDFGISVMSGQGRITQAGIAMGTPEYMSPEQCRGQLVDASSDIYSFGIILFEMISSQVPFTGETAMAIAYKQVNELAPDLEPLRAKIPRKLIEITERCLKKDKSERYASMEDVLLDLDLVVYDQTPEKRTKPSTQPIPVAYKNPMPSVWKGLLVFSFFLNMIVLFYIFQFSQKSQKIISPEIYTGSGEVLTQLKDAKASSWWEAPRDAKEVSLEIKLKSTVLVNTVGIQLPVEQKRSKFQSNFELILENSDGLRRQVISQDIGGWQWFPVEPLSSKNWKLRIRSTNNGNVNKPIALAGFKMLTIPVNNDD